jgi:hypothetical protein
MVCPSEIDQIEFVLRSVVPEILEHLGYKEASKLWHRVPPLRENPRRLSRMPKVLDEMHTRILRDARRTKRLELRTAAAATRTGFVRLRNELQGFAQMLVETRQMIEAYLEKESPPKLRVAE